MLTLFLIWFSGFIAAAILFYGNYEFLRDNNQCSPEKHAFLKIALISAGSWISIATIVWFIYEDKGLFWKFPTGKHYVELQKPVLSVLLFLSGLGSIVLVHGVNTHCILMNLSMVITVLISFFAALHPIKSQKDFFWAVFAMLFPMILDKVLHYLI